MINCYVCEYVMHVVYCPTLLGGTSRPSTVVKVVGDSISVVQGYYCLSMKDYIKGSSLECITAGF